MKINNRSSSSSNSPGGLLTVSLNNTWKQGVKTSKKISNKVSSAITSAFPLQLQSVGNVEPYEVSNPSKPIPSLGKSPASVARRNARERRRIKNVNSAFDELRYHVPHGDKSRKKISKVDTLQSAIEYIKALEELVRQRRAPSAIHDKENSLMTSRDSNSRTNANFFIRNTQSDDITKQTFEIDVPKQRTPASEKNDYNSSSQTDSRLHSSGEITETMLKAFDVMLGKCSSRKPEQSEKIESANTSATLQGDHTAANIAICKEPESDKYAEATFDSLSQDADQSPIHSDSHINYFPLSPPQSIPTSTSQTTGSTAVSSDEECLVINSYQFCESTKTQDAQIVESQPFFSVRDCDVDAIGYTQVEKQSFFPHSTLIDDTIQSDVTDFNVEMPRDNNEQTNLEEYSAASLFTASVEQNSPAFDQWYDYNSYKLPANNPIEFHEGYNVTMQPPIAFPDTNWVLAELI